MAADESPISTAAPAAIRLRLEIDIASSPRGFPVGACPARVCANIARGSTALLSLIDVAVSQSWYGSVHALRSSQRVRELAARLWPRPYRGAETASRGFQNNFDVDD